MVYAYMHQNIQHFIIKDKQELHDIACRTTDNTLAKIAN